MEQAEPIQLVSPDLLLEGINALNAHELSLALEGIARASGVEVVRSHDQPLDEVDARTPFGDQLMEEAEWAMQDADKPPTPTTYKEPLPTFSPNNKGNQIADDGGTGPGADE